jgi:hypothetical protein
MRPMNVTLEPQVHPYRCDGRDGLPGCATRCPGPEPDAGYTPMRVHPHLPLPRPCSITPLPRVELPLRVTRLCSDFDLGTLPPPSDYLWGHRKCRHLRWVPNSSGASSQQTASGIPWVKYVTNHCLP